MKRNVPLDENVTQRQNIFFLCPTLGSGGAERVIVYLLQHLNRKYYQPWLILLKKEGEFLCDVPADVPVIDLKKRHKLDGFKLLFQLAFRIFPQYKPALVVSFIDYTNLLALSAFLLSPFKPQIILRAGTHLNRDRLYRRFGSLQNFLIRLLYPLAKKIIAVSQGVAGDLVKNFQLSPSLVRVIYNGLDPDEIRRQAAEHITDNDFPVPDPAGMFQGQTLNLLACGRLTKAKNYPLLLRAYALAKDSLAPVDLKTRLWIIGEGNERPALETLINQLHPSLDVCLLGFKKNPFQYLSRADIFVSSSNCEGFPNVLLEAMVCGAAAVSTDCRSGPGEIIEDGVSGLLVPVNDTRELAAAIVKLAQNPGLRTRLALAGKERAEAFKLSAMLQAYEALIAEQLNGQQLVHPPGKGGFYSRAGRQTSASEPGKPARCLSTRMRCKA